MNAKTLTTAVITFSIAVVLFSSILVPVIGDASTTTTSVDNDGVIGLRMDKVSSENFTINYGLVGDDFTATNGTDTQVIDDLCIFYADNNVAVWMDDSSIIMLGKDASNNTIDEKLSDESTITITKSSAGLEITDGTITQTFPVPTWAYIPKSTGAYGFFPNETEINTAGLPVQYVGSFAGVNCYNSINTYDLPITIDAALTGSELSGARWIKQATETAPEELNPDDLHIIPLDPSVINPDPEPDASVMGSVPTPTYTDGDWGYELYTSGSDNGKARIVSYSGAGGDVVIPATVGGYNVIAIGNGINYNVFSTTVPIDSLTISEGIERINTDAFRQCLVKGPIVFPDSLKSIGQSAFQGCTQLNTNLKLPDNLKTLDYSAFSNCSSVPGPLIIPESVETITNSFAYMGNVNNLVILGSPTFGGIVAFSNTPINEILNFGDTVLSSGSQGLSNTVVIRQGDDADIPALGYLAPTQYKETVQNDGPASVLLNVIPLFVIIGLLIATVTMFIKKQ